MSGPHTNPFPNPFGSMMPGWDFLQNLGKGMPAHAAGAAGWVAPTLNVEDLDKRIQELKAVQYWLEQNARMLSATIQALEVQKMTLSTLKTMNVHVDELAQAMKVKPEDFMNHWSQSVAPDAPGVGAEEPAHGRASNAPKKAGRARAKVESAGSNGSEPLQWWDAVSQQFQEIAQTAAKDWQQHAAKAQEHLHTARDKAPDPKPKARKRTAAASPKAGSKRSPKAS